MLMQLGGIGFNLRQEDKISRRTMQSEHLSGQDQAQPLLLPLPLLGLAVVVVGVPGAFLMCSSVANAAGDFCATP